VPLVKKALAKAMHALPQIKQQHHSAKELPAPVQSAANADLAGILRFDGFGGRKKEWEIMLREHCQEQFAKVLEYFVCHVHNTSQTYGSLAKSLAPGTVQAITTHFDLPCRPSVKTLFVPSIEGTELVSIPYLLERFCKAYLPEGCTKVTVNLMRTWHHTELYRLTKSEDKLLGLLKSIDAHTIKVARQHYALQTPADGANLAKALVHSMIGKPVPWPSAIELADVGKHKATYLQLVNAMVDPHEDLAVKMTLLEMNGCGGRVQLHLAFPSHCLCSKMTCCWSLRVWA